MPEGGNDIKYSIVIVTAIIIILISFIAMLLILTYSLRNRQLKKLKIELEKQANLSQLEIRQQTLDQISREIHDNLGQVASLMKMGLETLLMNSQPDSKAGLQKIVELNRKLVSDLRGLSRTLNVDTSLSKGLDEALRQQVVLINQLGTTVAKIDVHTSIPEISPDKLTIIYRICQEALQNTLKHGNAKQIWINVNISKNNLILSIEDDGEGFLLDTVYRGTGISNMTSRAKLLGGRISIDSKPKKGTSVHIVVPINPSNEVKSANG